MFFLSFHEQTIFFPQVAKQTIYFLKFTEQSFSSQKNHSPPPPRNQMVGPLDAFCKNASIINCVCICTHSCKTTASCHSQKSNCLVQYVTLTAIPAPNKETSSCNLRQQLQDCKEKSVYVIAIGAI